jgi:hypothetical protein
MSGQIELCNQVKGFVYRQQGASRVQGVRGCLTPSARDLLWDGRVSWLVPAATLVGQIAVVMNKLMCNFVGVRVQVS